MEIINRLLEVELQRGTEHGDAHLAKNIKGLVRFLPFLEELGLAALVVQRFKGIFSRFDLALALCEGERSLRVECPNKLGPYLEEE